MSDRRKIFFPLLTLLAGAFLAFLVFYSRPKVERQVSKVVPPLIRVVETRYESVSLEVLSQGTVHPVTETTLSAQIPGQVTRVAGQFLVGGTFRRGDVLLTIDPRDAQAAVSQAEAQVAQNQVAVEREQAEAALALEEWQELGKGAPTALTLREPQLAQVRAGLAASQAALERAKLDLERTTVRAPFSGRIRTKHVDLGQYVAPGTPLAEMYATDVAEILLSVPKDQIVYLDLDLASGKPKRELSVTLSGEVGGQLRSWQGKITRTGGEIDGQTRMLDLFARVDDPLGQPNSPLPFGLFVEARIAGRESPQTIVLPRTSLRETNQVLVVDDQDRLRFRDVKVLRTQPETVLIADGLMPGERVCVSPIETVVDGMQIRTTEDASAAQPAAENSPQEAVTSGAGS